MADPGDGYDGYYQARLWESLPAIYRALDLALDTDGSDGTGPLRELINRIGTQVAVVRRSTDDLWADQSIETCADWVIPYIGDLVATRLVAGLDARGQRLDVANTIAWRRRKGTVSTQDAVARDITGWGVHVSEGFRRLARTRHNLDPAPTRTPAGGFADLRSAPGALLAGGPFDQAFHHADLRRGRGTAGWYGAEKFIVYCWRLQSLEVTAGTPVPVSGRAGEYVFDPTGREIPLFLPPSATAGTGPSQAAGTGPSQAWQVPGPLTSAVVAVMADRRLPAGYQVSGAAVGHVDPEAGRFGLHAPASGAISVSYHYGFGGQIGAGTSDPASAAALHAASELPVSGGSGLDGALEQATAGDTITITDSLTYPAVSPVSVGPGPLTVRARPGQRPVIRLAEHAPPWVFTGGEGAQLVLDGLFVSGGDIVLRGPFNQVRLVGCTLDPGTALDAGSHRDRRPSPGDRALARSADGRALVPTRLWLEGTPGPRTGPPAVIRRLEAERCVLGPIRTRNGGLAETIAITDSIIQGFRTSATPAFTADDVFDPALLYDQLSPGRSTPQRPRAQRNPLSAFVWKSVGGHVPERARRQLRDGPPDHRAAGALATAISRLTGPGDLYRPGLFSDVTLSPQARRPAGGRGTSSQRWRNRLLLEDAYPLALAPAAIAVRDATVILDRVTVLGRLTARRLHATDSILHGFAFVDDTEDGCVRYSAARAGSRLPACQDSAELSHGGVLFTSTSFGQPGYGQLLETAGATLLAGGSSGGQLGSFSTQITPVKEQALRLKYSEYLPVGLTPVVVHVT